MIFEKYLRTIYRHGTTPVCASSGQRVFGYLVCGISVPPKMEHLPSICCHLCAHVVAVRHVGDVELATTSFVKMRLDTVT